MRPSPILWLPLLAAACGTTRMTDTWASPELGPRVDAMQHVVAIAALPSEAAQRKAEDMLAAAATRVRISPAYTLIQAEDRGDGDRLRTALEQQGIDGAFTVRLVGVEEKTTYVPDTPRRTYRGGYYGYYGTVVDDPGHYRTDQYMKVETTFHDVETGELLWAGSSQTINPTNVEALIGGIIETARSDLRKRGVLQ